MNAVRILLLEDNSLDAEAIEALLIGGGIDCEIFRVQTRSNFVKALENQQFDLIFSDYSLPGFDGSSALKIARDICPEVPFIFVSGTLGEELAIEMLKSGATDYVLKQRLERLVPSVARALRETKERQERKIAEAALQESEAKFRQLADSMPQIVWMARANGEAEYVSRRWIEYTGLSLEQTGELFNIARVIHPDDFEPTYKIWGTCIETGTFYQTEFRLKQASDNAYRWFLCRAVPVKDDEGQVIYWYGTLTDIHDRKQTEEAFRQSEERFRLMVESARDFAIFTLDLNGLVTSWNSGAERLLGYFEAEIIGSDGEIIFTLEDRERGEPDKERQKALDRGRAENERWHLRKDGSRFWGSGLMMPLLDRANNVLGFVKILRDMTAAKQAGERESFLAEASAILASSIDYQITLSNIARLAVPMLADFCFFDIITDEKIQRVAWYQADPSQQEWFDRVQSYVPPRELQTHPVANVLLTGKPNFVPDVSDEWMQSVALNAEHLQFMRDFQMRSLIAVPLIVHDRKIGVLTLCMTTRSNRSYTRTDLKLAEELARRAALAYDNANLYQQAREANRIKDEFLAVLSHELRSPLNPILGWSRLLQIRNPDKATLIRGLETIERNAKLQTQLIDDLLDVSRILGGKLSLNVLPVNLVQAIEAAMETVRLAAEAKSLAIETRFDPDVGQVLGDAGRLQQVIWNLLSNAVKFTPNGGRVEITLSALENKEESYELEKSLNQNSDAMTLVSTIYAKIKVRDTGKGIAPDFLPYVFDYFRQADSTTTRKFGGLGLGLAIVRRLVELHGGTVAAESAGEGRGATFTVKLPLLEANRVTVPRRAATLTPVKEPDENLPLTGIRILVVDDEPDTLELITLVLEQAGADATAVTSVAEAIAALETSEPDILISDIGMPEEDGYSLIHRVRSRGSTMAAIALTAYAREGDRVRAITAGFQQHLSKPVEPSNLIAAVVKSLEHQKSKRK